MPTSQLPTQFHELISTHQLPILVDFWAEWCGPCKTLAPTIKQIAQDFKGKLTVIKVNVDEKQQLAAEHRIQGIPTLMLFDKGQVVWRISGALPYDQLKAELASRLK
ncbi:MAG TPA: thioredoxin [Candidatus Kapabacteria bacterium]|nr:thioredoxin [Candidatus Kapabacteria bacterium]